MKLRCILWAIALSIPLWLLLLALLAIRAKAESLPDAPSASANAATARPRIVQVLVEHRTAFAAYAGTTALDVGATCHNLGMYHGHEYFYPTQSCSGVAAFEAGTFVGVTLLTWQLERHGHHKLARLTPWIAAGVAGTWGMISASNTLGGK